MQYAKVFGLMAGLTALLTVLGGAFGGRSGALMFLAFAAVFNVGAYWFSDRMVLRMYKAQIVGPEQAPGLYKRVDVLRQRAGLPMPTVAIAPARQPNAFATGRSPERAVVCCTAGLLEAMSPDELDGVIAHELAHIKHRHMLVSTVAATIAGAVAGIARWGFFFSRGENRNPLVGLAIMIVAPIAAVIIQLAISRANEFQADATAARIMGSPSGLISALGRLEQLAGRVPMEVNPAAAQLAIVNPLSGGRASMGKLFRTHPPTEERIQALRGVDLSAA